jgi:hypothetical protein
MKGIATNMAEERKRHSRSTRASSTRNTAIHIRAGDAVKPILIKADNDKHFESRTMLIEWLLHCYDVGKMPRPPIRVTRVTSPLRPKAVSAKQQTSAWYMRPPVATANGTKKLDAVLAMTPAERKALGLHAFDAVILEGHEPAKPAAPQECPSRPSSAAAATDLRLTQKSAVEPSESSGEAVHDVIFESCDPCGEHDEVGCYWPMRRLEHLPVIGDHVRVWRPAHQIAGIPEIGAVRHLGRPHWHFGEVLPDPRRPEVVIVTGVDEHGLFTLGPAA